MAEFLDTFTDTATVLLTAHTPDRDEATGGWVRHDVIAATTAEISNANRARTTGTSAAVIYVEAADARSANVTLTAVGRAVTLQLVTYGMTGRYLKTADTGYLGSYSYTGSGTTSKYRIYKVVAGTYTELGASAELISATTDYAWTFDLNGSTLTLTVDGAQKVQVTGETTHTAAGRSGLRFQVGATGGDAAGWHWDTYTETATEITDIIGSGGPVPYYRPR